MKLYLIQHGRAKTKEEDTERPLSELGWTQTKKVAILMAAAGRIKPNKIYHSVKTRARQTAELIAQHLDLLDNLEQADGLAPMDDPSIWAENIVKTTKDVMLVGHLPHLEKLAALLLFQDENKTTIKFQNSGILCLERDDSSAWSLEWMVVPQVLP
jgi:phosphohistidine phosphatase